MSIPNLPVDFKDDILASSNTKRKYRQTANDDSTVSFEDVTNYSQEGSEFGAKEVNQTNTAINNIYDERVLDVDALELITEPGFFVDAQAVKELNGKMPVIQSGTGTLAYANYAVCTARVTFPEPFDEVPDITITPIVPSEGSWNSTRNSITNSTYMIAGKTKEYFDVRSFSIQDDYTETLTIQFDWMAKL